MCDMLRGAELRVNSQEKMPEMMGLVTSVNMVFTKSLQKQREKDAFKTLFICTTTANSNSQQALIKKSSAALSKSACT